MDARGHLLLLSKCTVGVGASYLASLFSSGWDEAFKEVAVLGGILVSFLTVLNLMWSLLDKIHAIARKKTPTPVTVNQIVEMAADAQPEVVEEHKIITP